MRKGELGGKIIVKFVGPHPKMNSNKKHDEGKKD